MDLTGRKRTNAPGFVYLLTNGAHEGVKIGSTKNPAKRLKEFNISDPLRDYRFFDLKFFKRGYFEAEKILHHILQPQRGKGEWFAMDPNSAKAVLKRLHLRKE